MEGKIIGGKLVSKRKSCISLVEKNIIMKFMETRPDRSRGPLKIEQTS